MVGRRHVHHTSPAGVSRIPPRRRALPRRRILTYCRTPTTTASRSRSYASADLMRLHADTCRNLQHAQTDGVGFEPTSRFRDCRFSRPVHSTALPPIQTRSQTNHDLVQNLTTVFPTNQARHLPETKAPTEAQSASNRASRPTGNVSLSSANRPHHTGAFDGSTVFSYIFTLQIKPRTRFPDRNSDPWAASATG